MKKILFITDSININDSSGSKANVAFIFSCAKYFNVKVIHCSPNDITLDGVHTHRIDLKKIGLGYLIRGGFRYLHRHFKIDLNRKFETIFGFSFDFFTTVNLIRNILTKNENNNFDYYITLSKGASFRPHFALLPLTHLHQRWIAYIHDPYPFQFYPRPYNFVPPGYRQKFKFFDKMSKTLACFAFPSLLLSEWMISYFPEMKRRCLVIPHQKLKQEEEINISKNDMYFDLIHSGTLINGRPISFLLEAFYQLTVEDESFSRNARLHFYGPMNDQKSDLIHYKQLIPNQLLFNIGYVDFNEIQKIQYNATANIIVESYSEISPFLPGKFPHLLSANRKILLLSPFYSETKRLLGSDYPYWSEVNDISNIKRNIHSLFETWKKYGRHALSLDRPDLDHYFSSDYLYEQLNSI